MASAYPAALDALPTNHLDGTGEIIHAQTIDDLADAVNKIESVLGINPQGAFANLAARLAAYSRTTIAVAASNAPAAFKQTADYVCDGVNDHVEINQALLDAKGNGSVTLSPGTFTDVDQIVGQDRTWLRGAGWATKLVQKAGANKDLLINFVSPDGIVANAEYVVFSDMWIDGNKANQGAGSTGRGVFFTASPSATKATNDLDFDPHNRVEKMLISNTKGDGFAATSRSETRVIDVYAWLCDGNGFAPSFDTWMGNCTSAWAGLAGFYFVSSSVRGSNLKAFYSGQVTPSSGKGFWAKSTHGIILAACEAQDNKDAGFLADSCSGALNWQGSADSNSTRGAGLAPGLDVFATLNSQFVIACYERNANGNNQTHALRIRSASTGNDISVSHTAGAGATVGAALDSSSDSVAGNSLLLNGTQRFLGLGTVDPHVVGQLWNNGGVVTVSAG